MLLIGSGELRRKSKPLRLENPRLDLFSGRFLTELPKKSSLFVLVAPHLQSRALWAWPHERRGGALPSVCPQHTDMPEEMRVETMELCVTACEKFATNNEVRVRCLLRGRGRRCLCDDVRLPQSAAKMIKESMDKKFGSSWHVVIGEGFGFEVTHEVKNLLYMFFGGSLAVCVWKCS
uniref:Dynein light chain n=1 Tax=Gasterosteus aculeatus aculeatus TaxID=481459 RepID=A0AAQ4PEM9_GASAC